VHEIRHTTATLLQELGVDEGVQVAIMGHSTVASTRKYEHVDLGPMRLALAQAAERLDLRS
jgi:site-specific recombinase XerD